jgi:hypothetical protein
MHIYRILFNIDGNIQKTLLYRPENHPFYFCLQRYFLAIREK